MNEKIPQLIILDLLPLYLADEVSAETRQVIDDYLKSHPQFAILTCMAGIAYIFLWDEPRGAQAPYVFGGLATLFWLAFFLANKKIDN